MKIYRIQFKANECHVELRVNDIPVLSMLVEGSLATEIDINQYITEGENTLVAFGKNSIAEEYIASKISTSFVSESENAQSIVPVVKKDLIEGNTVKFEIPKGAVSPQPWSKKPLPVSAEFTRSVFDSYNTMISLVSEKNWSKFIELSLLKDTHFANVYDISYEKQKQRLEEAYRAFSDNIWELKPIDWSEFSLHYYNWGRIVCLIDKQGDPPVIMQNRLDGREFIIDVFLGMTERGLKWVI